MNQASHVCKNCSKSFSGNFCNYCGQKTVHRITMGHVTHDLVHVFLHADKGVFAFAKKLVSEPGILARNYVEGKRKIFNPYQYLIFSVAVVLFLMSQSKFYQDMETYNAGNASKFPLYFQKAMGDFNFFIKKYANVITFMTLPVYAFFSWLFFKKKALNYAEHLTILVFAISLSNTLTAFVFLLLLLFSLPLFGTVVISMLIIVAALFMVYKQFFSLSWIRALGKAIAVYAVSYTVQVVMMGIGLLVYVWLVKSRQ